MKIVIVTYGSRGDVQPILALALALQSKGHSVLMAGPPENVVTGLNVTVANSPAWAAVLTTSYPAARMHTASNPPLFSTVFCAGRLRISSHNFRI